MIVTYETQLTSSLSSHTETMNQNNLTTKASTLIARHAPRTDAIPQQQNNTQAAGQAQAQANQQRSRALFPLLVALAAYLFISRLASIMGGTAGTSTSNEI